jgi:protein-S-isoprenylcysteine O-methyltransferase Ste14
MMSGEQPFRIALLGAMLFLLAVAMPHRLRSRTDEALDRRQEGLFILIALRAAGVAAWLGILTYLINPSWMAWSSLPLPASLRWCGLALAVGTAALLSSTLRHLGPNLTDTVVTRREHVLVIAGPYRWVRNPFYGCAALLMASASLLSANAFILGAGAVAVGLLVVRTTIEEQKLTERFGDTFREYMRTTPRFVPGSGLWWRALAAFLVLPGTIAFLIPLVLLGPARLDRFTNRIGLLPLALGIGLLLWCVRDFYVAGRGTLAPWDPPTSLVVTGLYRYSRNPMYVGVLLILAGWAIGFRSPSHAGYALLVAAMFHLRVLVNEEPYLHRAHGDAWTAYTRTTRRWV